MLHIFFIPRTIKHEALNHRFYLNPCDEYIIQTDHSNTKIMHIQLNKRGHSKNTCMVALKFMKFLSPYKKNFGGRVSNYKLEKSTNKFPATNKLKSYVEASNITSFPLQFCGNVDITSV